MSAEASKALMHRFMEEWNKGDIEALNRIIDETVDSTFVNHSATNPEERRGP